MPRRCPESCYEKCAPRCREKCLGCLSLSNGCCLMVWFHMIMLLFAGLCCDLEFRQAVMTSYAPLFLVNSSIALPFYIAACVIEFTLTFLLIVGFIGNNTSCLCIYLFLVTLWAVAILTVGILQFVGMLPDRTNIGATLEAERFFVIIVIAVIYLYFAWVAIALEVFVKKARMQRAAAEFSLATDILERRRMCQMSRQPNLKTTNFRRGELDARRTMHDRRYSGTSFDTKITQKKIPEYFQGARASDSYSDESPPWNQFKSSKGAYSATGVLSDIQFDTISLHSMNKEKYRSHEEISLTDRTPTAENSKESVENATTNEIDDKNILLNKDVKAAELEIIEKERDIQEESSRLEVEHPDEKPTRHSIKYQLPTVPEAHSHEASLSEIPKNDDPNVSTSRKASDTRHRVEQQRERHLRRDSEKERRGEKHRKFKKQLTRKRSTYGISFARRPYRRRVKSPRQTSSSTASPPSSSSISMMARSSPLSSSSSSSTETHNGTRSQKRRKM